MSLHLQKKYHYFRGGASFLQCPIFLTMNFFRMSNVRPEIPTTTEFPNVLFSLTIDLLLDLERSAGNFDYHRNILE